MEELQRLLAETQRAMAGESGERLAFLMGQESGIRLAIEALEVER